MRYDQFNCAPWGIIQYIYVAEIKQLPEEVKKEFVIAEFVVKCSANKVT